MNFSCRPVLSYCILFSVTNFILISCATQKASFLQPIVEKIDLQGHRGCRGLLPENTIPAMQYALKLGVQTLEMDVVISKDSQVILSHEPFFSHEISTLPNGDTLTESSAASFNLFQMNYDRIQLVDVGLKEHPRFPGQQKISVVKPLLSAVIDSAERLAVSEGLALPMYNIETKTTPQGDSVFHPSPDVFVDLLMRVIYQKNVSERVIIQSFDVRTLQYLHQKYPTIKTALLVEEGDGLSFSGHLKQLGFIPNSYSPEHTLVTPLLVSQCHSMQMTIIPWTVNDLPTMKILLGYGVDGIISDYPNLFLSLKQKPKKTKQPGRDIK